MQWPVLTMMLALAAPEASERSEGPAETSTDASSASEPEPEPTVVPPVEPPQIVHFEPAVRPVDAEETGEVAVLMLLQIEADGLVTEIEVLESGGAAFDDAAVAAAERFVFEPALLDGEAIAVQIEYRYVFDALPPRPPEVAGPAGSSDVSPDVSPDGDPSPEPGPAPEPASEPEALEIDDSETIRAPPVVREAAQIDLEAESAERIAGAQGDSIKAMRTLGGVARPSASDGELVVWGASPDQTRSYVDWMPVPRLFHLGGTRSVVPTPMVERVTLVPGGVGPAYGRAIGGLVRVDTVAPRSVTAGRRWGTVARADAIDVGVGADALLTDRGWAGFGVRRSVLDRTYGALLPSTAEAVVPLPTYWDYQAKAEVRVDEEDSLALVAIGSHDRVTRTIPSLTPDQRFDETQVRGFHRLGARLLRVRADGSSLIVAAWAGRDDDDVAQHFAEVTAASHEQRWQGGLRIAERRRVAEFLTVELGLDAEAARTELDRRGAITLPAREGDIVVFGQPPGDRVSSDTWTVIQGSVAGYGSLAFAWAQGRFTAEPGLRLEPLVTAVDRILPVRPVDPEVGRTDVELAVDPRVRLGWNPRPDVSLYAAAGRYHQAAAPSDLSALFGNPRLAAAQAYHAVIGTVARPVPWMQLHAAGFFIHARRLAMRSADPTPEVASLLQSEGQGRNVGGQLSARFSGDPAWSAGLTYALTRAERRRDPAAAWRLFDSDQTHALQVLGHWQHDRGLTLGGRVALSSGNPRTAVVGAVQDAGTGSFDPIFGAHNAVRLPAFFSASARVGWGRSWAWGRLRTWLDVINVTHHPNAEEVFYTADFSRQGFVRGLPLLPSLGLEVRL